MSDFPERFSGCWVRGGVRGFRVAPFPLEIWGVGGLDLSNQCFFYWGEKTSRDGTTSFFLTHAMPWCVALRLGASLLRRPVCGAASVSLLINTISFMCSSLPALFCSPCLARRAPFFQLFLQSQINQPWGKDKKGTLVPATHHRCLFLRQYGARAADH